MSKQDRVERLKTPTNKKVVAKSGKSVGVAVKTASGSKRIKPGDGSKPANTRAAYETQGMKDRKEKAAEVEKLRKGGGGGYNSTNGADGARGEVRIWIG